MRFATIHAMRTLLVLLSLLLIACPSRRTFGEDDDDSAGDDDDTTGDDDDSAGDDDDSTGDDDDATGDDDDSASVDADGDGYPASTDCDETNDAVHPGATEICGNLVDDDCSGDAPSCRWSGTVGLNTAFLRLDGVADDRLGLDGVVADVTGDGTVDLVLPASRTGTGDLGSVFVLSTPLIPGIASVDSRAVSRIDGALPGEQLGGGLLVADLDDDGTNDILAGAPTTDFAGLDAGALYTFFGPVAPGVTTASTANLVIDGDTMDGQLGWGFMRPCDLNGDGVQDLVQRAFRANPLGRSLAGTVYVWYGPLLATDSLASADAQIFGAASEDRLGNVMSCDGDLDGDGDDDLAIAAQGAEPGGAVYVFYDDPSGLIDLATTAADATIVTATADDLLGQDVRIVEDTDGDGADDLMVGARTADLGSEDSGGAWLVTGAPTGTVDVADLAVSFAGIGLDERAGQAVNTIGDLDGDGHVDFLIGARRSDYAGTNSGATYVVYGPVTGAVDLADADAVIVGDSPTSGSSSFIQPVADITGDGRPDLLIGAYLADHTGEDAGSVYVLEVPTY